MIPMMMPTVDPYAEWRGGAWLPIGRTFTPTPSWEAPPSWHSLGPFSGEPSPAQQDLGMYNAPGRPSSVGPETWLSIQVRDGGGHEFNYYGSFATASAPAIPTDGPTLAGIGVC